MSELLITAARENNLADVTRLLEDADVNYQTPEAEGHVTALHHAVKGLNLDMIRALVERGADVDLVDSEGFSPLTQIMQWHHLNEAQMLPMIDLMSPYSKNLNGEIKTDDILLNDDDIYDEDTLLNWAAAMHYKYITLSIIKAICIPLEKNSSFEPLIDLLKTSLYVIVDSMDTVAEYIEDEDEIDNAVFENPERDNMLALLNAIFAYGEWEDAEKKINGNIDLAFRAEIFNFLLPKGPIDLQRLTKQIDGVIMGKIDLVDRAKKLNAMIIRKNNIDANCPQNDIERHMSSYLSLQEFGMFAATTSLPTLDIVEMAKNLIPDQL